MTAYNWDFTRLSTIKYETNTHQIKDEFNSISLKTETADVDFVSSEDGKCKVVCYEPKNAKHSVTVQDGTLTINAVDERKWYEHMGITFDSPKVTVYIPQGEYGALSVKSSTGNVAMAKHFKFESINISTSTGDVKCLASTSEKMKLKTTTGNIRVENASAGTLDLSVSTGKVTVSNVNCERGVTVSVSTGKTYLTDIACQNITSSGSTGNISLENVLATERFSIERSTGHVKFDSCDAAEIFVETDTGDVTGSLLSEKVFIIETSTGDVSVPQSITGGKCEINTSTGDIRISISYPLQQ